MKKVKVYQQQSEFGTINSSNLSSYFSPTQKRIANSSQPMSPKIWRIFSYKTWWHQILNFRYATHFISFLSISFSLPWQCHILMLLCQTHKVQSCSTWRKEGKVLGPWKLTWYGGYGSCLNYLDRMGIHSICIQLAGFSKKIVFSLCRSLTLKLRLVQLHYFLLNFRCLFQE